MKKRFSKFLALVLVALMIVTAMPVSAVSYLGRSGKTGVDNGSGRTFSAKLENGLTVEVAASKDAFPKTLNKIKMVATAVEQVEAVQSAVDSTPGVSGRVLAAVDITFYNGRKQVQPSVPVTVTLSSDDFYGRNGISVVHLNTDVKGLTKSAPQAELISGVKYQNGSVVFDASSFSIYAGVEGAGGTRFQVDFYSQSNEHINRQFVLTGSLVAGNTPVYDPGMPTLGDNQAFGGWKLVGTGTAPAGFEYGKTYTVNKINEILIANAASYTSTFTMDFQAVVEDVVFVSYTDQNGVVWKTDPVPLNHITYGDFTYDSENFAPEGQNVGLVGWVVMFENGQATGYVVEDTDNDADYKYKVVDGSPYGIPGAAGTAAHELILYPLVKRGQWLYFNANLGNDGTSATYTAPRFIPEGETPFSRKPADPTRKGYTFDEWYTDANHTTAFNWNDENWTSQLTNNTVYANWTPDGVVSYKIVFWTQNRNDDYTTTDANKNWDYYVPTAEGVVTEGTAAAGSTVTLQSATSGKIAYNRLGRNSDYYSGRANNGELGYFFKFNQNLTETSKVIRGDGTTVFNIYYDRATITLTYRSGSTTGTVLYTDKGLYEHDYTFRTASSGYHWQYYDPNANNGSGVTYIITDATKPNFYNNWIDCSELWNIYSKEDSTWDGYRNLYYQTQGLDGQYSTFRTGRLHYDTYTSGWTTYIDTDSMETQYVGGFEYFGFTGIGYNLQGNSMTNSYYHTFTATTAADGAFHFTPDEVGSSGAYIYYQRNKWDLRYYSNGVFYSGNDMYNGGEKIYFEQDISGYKYFEPTNGPEGHYFAGWYKDPSCTKEYTFTGNEASMPNNSLLLYAKWEPEWYRIVFDLTDGGKVDPATIVIPSDSEHPDGQDPTFCVPYGAKIDGACLTKVTTTTGLIFGGWFYDAEHTKPFSFDTEIGPNIPEAGDPDGMDMTYATASDSERQDQNNYWKPWSDVGEDGVRGKLVLYPLWRQQVVGSDGIQVRYDAVEGDGLIYVDSNGQVIRYDPFTYTDGALAFTRYSATPNDNGEQFLYWEILDKNGNVVRTVYPGETFPVNLEWAVAEAARPTYTITWHFLTTTGWDSVTTTVSEGDIPSHGAASVEYNNVFYRFTGNWNSKQDGTGTAPVAAEANAEYYAQYTVEEVVAEYTVTFLDWDNSVLSTQTVYAGDAATAPADPVRTGYTFTGWDVDFTNVQSNLTVTAQYQINTYTVTFVDGLTNETISTVTVNYGEAATAPAAPAHAGYTFTGWDTAFSNVTSNLTVTALYESNVVNYTVTYVANGETVGTDTVQSGNNVTLPATATAPSGYTFAGWVTAELNNETTTAPTYYQGGTTYGPITGDTTLYALFTRTQAGGKVYNLVTSAPSSWAGNYVITSGTSTSAYAMKGLSSGTSYQTSGNGGQVQMSTISGLTISNNTMYNVPALYVFTLAGSGSSCTIQNTSTGTYLRNRNSSLQASTTSTTWTMGFSSPYTTIYNSRYIRWYNSMFQLPSSSSNGSGIYLWKETAGEAVTYYTTSPLTPTGVAYELTSSLAEGDDVIVVVGSYAVGNAAVSSGHYLNAKSVTVSGTTLSLGSTAEADVLWHVGGDATNGWTFYNASVGKYIGLDPDDEYYLKPTNEGSGSDWYWTYDGTDLSNNCSVTANQVTDSSSSSYGKYYYYFAARSTASTGFTTTTGSGNNVQFYKKTATFASVQPAPTDKIRKLENVDESASIVSTGVNNYQTRISNNETRDSEVWVPVDTIDDTSAEYLIGIVDGNTTYLISSKDDSGNYYTGLVNSTYQYLWYVAYMGAAVMDGVNVIGVSGANVTNLDNCKWKFSSTTGGTISSVADSGYYLYCGTGTVSSGTYSGYTYFDTSVDTYSTTWTYDSTNHTLSSGGVYPYHTTLSNSNPVEDYLAGLNSSSYAGYVQLYKKQTTAPTTYTVTYDANGATSGTAPTDSNSPYNSGSTVTVLGNTGNLAKTGYTFNGWNTQANGNGTHYAAGATFTISADTTLYAEWIINTYTVTFKDWDGTVLKTQQVNHGGAATAPADPSRAGYTFTGWDVAFNNVQSDLIVTAQYQENVTPGTNVTYVLVDQPVNGVSYILVADDSISGTTGYAVSATILNTNYLTPVEVTVASDKSTVTVSSSALNGISWTAAASGSGFTWQNVGNGNYLSVTNPANAYLTASSTAYAWVYNSDGSFQNTSVTDGYEYMTYGEPNTNANYYRYTVGPESLKDIIHLYAPARTLTIIYQYANGTTAATTYTAVLGQGASYSVTSPTVNGYTPDQAVVSGTIGASDVTVTVTYTQNGGGQTTQMWTPTDTILPGEPYLIGFVFGNTVYLATNDGQYYTNGSHWLGYTARAVLDSDNALSAHVIGLNDFNEIYTDLSSCTWTFSEATGGIIKSTEANRYLSTYSSTRYQDLYADTSSTYGTGWVYDAAEYTLSRVVGSTTRYARGYVVVDDNENALATIMAMDDSAPDSDDIYIQLYSLQNYTAGETYTVSFTYYDENGELTTVTYNNVAYGQEITPPEVPDRPGYTFDGWDAEGYLSVTESHNYVAQYIQDGSYTYTVYLRAVYGTKNTTGKTTIVLDANGLTFVDQADGVSILNRNNTDVTSWGTVLNGTTLSYSTNRITLTGLEINDAVNLPNDDIFVQSDSNGSYHGYKIIGWNTKADGSGMWVRFDGTGTEDDILWGDKEWLAVGLDNLDRTDVNTHINTLYAMWEGYSYVYHSADNTIERYIVYSTDSSARVNDKLDLVELASAKTDYLYGGYSTTYYGGMISGTTGTVSWAADNYTASVSGGKAYDPSTPYASGFKSWWKSSKMATAPGNAITPVIGQVYYVKEVTNQYLPIKCQYIYELGLLKIQQIFALTCVDDTNYREVGIRVTIDGVTEAKTYQPENEGDPTLFGSVTIYNSDGSVATTIGPKNFGPGQNPILNRGYVTYVDCGLETDGDGFILPIAETDPVYLEPYWITPDGVTVISPNTRTFWCTDGTINGIGKDR